MARTRTLVQLRAEVRERADIENDPHVSDSEVTRFINQSIAALHDQVTLACQDDYTTSQAISTVNGTEAYALAAAFYKLVSVEVTINGRTRQIGKWTFEERARYLNVTTWGLVSQPVAYRLVGSDSIRFMPIPDGVYSVTVWYIPAATQLALDADTYDGRDGWEEWVVLDAAIKAKTKSEEDVRDLTNERDRVWLRIEKSFPTKDQARPDKIVETVRHGVLDIYGLPSPIWWR